MYLTHGQTGTRLHETWKAMRYRCNNPNYYWYSIYGGRGIRVCKRWDSYTSFAADVGPHPGKGWTLDRINNNGDYEPSNVRWATRKTQSRNTRRCRITTKDAKHMKYLSAQKGLSNAAIAAKFGVDKKLVYRVVSGFTWA